jgi:voltage-gated sodium channel
VQSFPEWFGTLGASAYSLFQIMTLESWSMGIVRPVMEVYPYAWAFFVPFIMMTTFAVVNLLVGLIVNSTISGAIACSAASRAAARRG